MRQAVLATLLLGAAIAESAPAQAQAQAPAPATAFGVPVSVGGGVRLDPIADVRLRYENVDQPTLKADAVTARLRAGLELQHVSGFSLLAEGDATAALGKRYNAFPFAIASAQRRPQFAGVSDPESLDLNRLQVQWKSPGMTLTVGRQRISLDDQRWVGNANWRQNEQTYEAVRGEAKAGPLTFDGAYMVSQRTVLGSEAGPRRGYDGEFVLLGAGGRVGAAQVKAFAYLLDYSEAFLFPNSNATLGARAIVPASFGQVKASFAASYARQSDYGRNLNNYAADYLAAEAALTRGGLTATAGWEKLGSDGGRFAVQTPMGAVHKFDGWADVFATTPAGGVQDAYGGIAYAFRSVKALPGLNALITYHRFNSDFGNVVYGDEWDASAGFRVGRVALLAKYADYRPNVFGVRTRKMWLMAEASF